MKRLYRLAFAAALCSSALFARAEEAALDLKPQWIIGKRYSQTMTMKQESSFAIGDQKLDQTMVNSTDITTTVSAHEDGQHKRLLVHYGRVVLDMEMAGQKMHFDSNAPETSQDPLGIGKVLGAFAGKDLKVVMDENNRVTDIENLDELTASALTDNPAAGQLKQMFSKESMSQMFDSAALKALPGKAVKPGDSWPFSVTMNLPQLGAVSINGEYTYKGSTERGGAVCAEIAQHGQLKMDLTGNLGGADAEKLMEQLGLKFEDGAETGTQWFDPKIGTARESEMVQTMKIRMNNPAKPGESFEIPMKQTVSVILTKIEDVK